MAELTLAVAVEEEPFMQTAELLEQVALESQSSVI
jgi:hypothetical protein